MPVACLPLRLPECRRFFPGLARVCGECRR